MQNLWLAAQTAFYTALKPLENDTDLIAAVGTSVKVYTHVPQGTNPPFIKVNVVSAETEGEAGYVQVERLSVEIIGVFRGAGNTALLAMIHAARELLDGQMLSAVGAYLQPPYYLSFENNDPINVDGLTYIGVMTFEVLAESAE